MTETTGEIMAVDSLSANEFHVEINGEIATGIFAVSGICVRHIDLEKQKLVHKPLVVTKMVQQNPELPFNQWTRETLTNSTSKVIRDIAVVAMDENVEVRRWVFKAAWISSIEFSDFNTASEVLIEERLTIHHAGVEETWPSDSAS